MKSWIDRCAELQAASETAVTTYAMRRILDEFLFALNSGERAFVLEMLHHLVTENVEPRPGRLDPHAGAHLRHYLQAQQAQSFYAGVMDSLPVQGRPNPERP